MTSEFMEAFCMGYNAAADGVPNQPEEFLAAMNAAWERTGGQRAARLLAGLPDSEAQALTADKR